MVNNVYALTHFLLIKKYTSLTLAQLTQLITYYRFTDIIVHAKGATRSPKMMMSSDPDTESSGSFATFLAAKQHHVIGLLGHDSKLGTAAATTLSIVLFPVGLQLI